MTRHRSKPTIFKKGITFNIFLILILAFSLSTNGQNETQYKSILVIELEHDYFKTGYDPSMRIEPDQQTRSVFQEKGLLIQQKEKWFSIYAPNSFDLKAYLHENNSFWQFVCIPSDPSFLNFTDMGLGPGMWLFSNENLDEGNTILNSKLIPTEAVGPHAGTIDIHLNNLPPEDPEKPIQYKARFNSRLVSIRYYITINKQGVLPISLEGDHADLFSDPVLTDVTDSKKTYIIDSGNNLIPLKKNPSTRLKLIYLYNSNENEVVLPHALPSNFIVEGQKYISPIYVHI